jgi:hypothetical protein
LELTSDDINALIDDEPDLKGKIYVNVEGDKVKGQVSIPLEKVGLPMLRGRYLNGEADVKASLSDGVLLVTLDSLEVNGKKVPEDFMKGIRTQNMAKDMYKDEKSAEMLRKLERLEVKDGKIILKIRARPGDSSGAPTSKEPAAKDSAPPADEEPKPAPAKKD